MYCATMFCRRQIESSIVWNPASSFAAAAEVYFDFPSGFRHGSLPVSRRTNWSWNPPRALPMQGVTTQISKPKSKTPCTTYLKKFGHPRLCPFPAEDSRHLLPHHQCLGQVPDYRCPVAVRRQDNPSQVLEVGHHI